MNQTQRNFIINQLQNAVYDLTKTTIFFYTKEGKEFIRKELASGKHKLNEDAFFISSRPYASEFYPTLYKLLDKKSSEHYKKEEARIKELRPKLNAKLDELKARIMFGPVGCDDLAAMLQELRSIAK